MGSGITHTLMVPTLYQALLSMPGEVNSWPDEVIVAGEACPTALVQAHFASQPTSGLVNEYGPTEATVWCTAHRCSPADLVVPIGQPIAGVWIAVVDEDDLVRPAGVEGDLIVGGSGVVAGYLGDPERTAAKFGVLALGGADSDETEDSQRFFRTGDRAAVIDGAVRFFGRGDTQLNIGGTRVEPEDIEDALITVEGVTAAIAAAVDVRPLTHLLDSLPAELVGPAMSTAASAEDPTSALLAALREHGVADLRLVAHVEASDRLTDPLLRDELRRAAAARLPGLLRPAAYTVHDELPRTPNGKLDRTAAAAIPLPTADRAVEATTELIPSSEPGVVEPGDDDLIESLTRLFAATLRADDFGPDESFFDHGGHSLLAMELLLAVEDAHKRRIPAGVLYSAPTPRSFAAHLRQDAEDRATTFLVPIQTLGSKPPIFAVHVLGVDCAFFRPLSARLGNDQPMYGLGQPTADPDTDAPTEVAAVAAAYAMEIDRVAPDGPISLAAISLGGIVAYELAQQLFARGRTVTLLALFDALGPDAAANGPSPSMRIQTHVDRLTTHPRRYASEQFERQGQRVIRIAERSNIALRRRLNVRSNHQLEVRRFIEDNIRSQYDYDFEAYPGPMLVLKAGDDPFADIQVASGMGWARLAAGGPRDRGLSWWAPLDDG